MSEVQHITSVTKRCIRYLSNLTYFQEVRCREGQLMLDIMNALSLCNELVYHGRFCSDERLKLLSSLRKETGSDFFVELLLSQRKTFAETTEVASTILLNSIYNIIGFNPLHNLHLGIPKLLEEITFIYLGSDNVKTHSGGLFARRLLLSQMWLKILLEINFLLAATDRDAAVSVSNADVPAMIARRSWMEFS